MAEMLQPKIEFTKSNLFVQANTIPQFG